MTAYQSEAHDPETMRDGMRYRRLGRTGEEVSAIGLGGHHIGRQSDEQDSIRLIRSAIDAGINFMDNSGTITTASVSAAWGRRCGAATATGSS